MNELQVLSQHHCFGGTQTFFQHHSNTIDLPMRFSVFQPSQAQKHPVPVLFFLAGLTCTEATFMIKAGAQRHAAKLGIMLISMDTSPPATNIAGENDNWDFGVGAGFYLGATLEPWSKHYKMEQYITQELREIVLSKFPAEQNKVGIFGHSMGGHGALVLALRNPKLFLSVSAFAPIAAPSHCPWGQKAFRGYLGDDQVNWRKYDATALIEDGYHTSPILIDQGLSDQFLAEQLLPERFKTACQHTKQNLTFRYQEGYDHSYYFISTFITEHLQHHCRILTE